MTRPPPRSPLFPSPPLFRSREGDDVDALAVLRLGAIRDRVPPRARVPATRGRNRDATDGSRGGDEFFHAEWTGGERRGDRKSTRLNSSHSQISYAVFCLKKK